MPKTRNSKPKNLKSKPGPKPPPPLVIEGDPMKAFSHFLGYKMEKKGRDSEKRGHKK